MSSTKSFDEFYSSELEGCLFPLETYRKKVAKTGIAGFILAALSIFLFFVSSADDVGITSVFAVISLITAAVFFIVSYYRKKEYVASFKESIVRRVVSFIDPSLHYSPSTSVSRKDYDISGLFLQRPDRYKGDDYIEGTRDRTFFSFSELHTEEQVSNGKTTSWVTIFKGLFFIADFNKNFQGRTYVWSENNPQLNFFTKIFSSVAWNLEKVSLESVEFERKFVVYSTDQVEARFILTPSLMERLVKLEQMMGAGTSFSFVNTNIYVAVPIKDKLFEPNVYSPNDYLTIKDYYKTVHIVFDIIDELKLNDRLWGKE